MCYTQTFLAIITLICSLLLTFLPSKTLPWNWPLMKLLPTAYLRSHELYDKLTQVLAESNGTILCRTSWYTNVDTLVTSDPRNVQHVLNSRSSLYQRGSEFRKVFDFLGEAVFVKGIKEWKEDKKVTHGFFKESGFHAAAPGIIRRTLETGLVPVLRHAAASGGVLDLQEVFSRYMIDATCLMATGSDMASLRVGFPPCPLREAMDDMADAVFWRNVLPEKVWRMQNLLGVGTERKMARACNDLNQIIDSLMSSRKNQDLAGGGGGFDVLEYYIAGGDRKETLTKEFIKANIMTLFFAARDTSAAILTWFFYLISANPRVKKAVLEEIERISPAREHLFSDAEDLSKLVYLHCALTESLRLFPPAPVIMRDPTEEDVLPSGHRVGKSTKIVMCSYAMAREAAIWGDDCGEFKPERWMCKGGGVRHVASHSFLAFGSGPWACPGRELALARMKGVAATILHNFDVEVLEGQRVSPSVSAFLTVKNGLKASVSSRWL
ncbi:alkane hydroxylase MAH1-like [Salvia miltiorrhiza]|uniref:alkane hydroxylase MAH1-like n=1 Tax=Salvia miltiorrhiza TaxID=226208 RepID=UPI0025AD42AE|nr:alkane hydroxylase MAH1-like [Salvia miltiorrhiza]